MISLGWLPSMFAAMSRQRKRPETEEERVHRINSQSLNNRINDEYECASTRCLKCNHVGMNYERHLMLGVCRNCGEELSMEFIRNYLNQQPPMKIE